MSLNEGNGQISGSSETRREIVMRQRKGRSEVSEETLNSEEKGGDFFACYLLASLSPRHKGHSYIGFTVNPRRRIRQHNGEITCGALRTKRKRPWEMVLCIYGFPTNVSALQFEWAWQHPTESLAVRKAAADFKSLSGIANKIKLAYTMLTLPAWQSLNLTVNFFSTKYMKHSAGCPCLPGHMRVQVSPMDQLPCYSGSDHSLFDNGWGDEEELGERGIGTEVFDQATVNEDIALEQLGQMEERGLRQPGDSPSPVRASSSRSKEGTLDDNDTAGLSKENNVVRTKQLPDTVAADRGEPKVSPDAPCEMEVIDLLGCSPDYRTSPCFKKRMKQLPDTVAADRGEPKIFSHAPCEMEVIDLLGCSPDYRTSPCFKKRRAAKVNPEIIDLTNSPIFVQL